jgi:predicted Zn-dependent protease
MAFVKSVPEAEESVATVLRRYPQQALLIMELADLVMSSGDCKGRMLAHAGDGAVTDALKSQA